MNEPQDCINAVEVGDVAGNYFLWARENKKRADRLLAAAKEVLWDLGPGFKHLHSMQDLQSAITDYEDKRG